MSARGNFSSRIGFILAAAGSAVGLGNIWKFPFEVADGGGAAFVIIYLLFAFVLCFPVMVTEVAIGRKTEKNPIGAFNSLGFKRWNIIGKFGILCGVLILSFYNVVAGWAFGYFLEMIMGNFGIGENFGVFTSDVIKVLGYAIIFMFSTAFIVSKGVSGGIEKLAKILMPTLIIMILSLVVYSFTLPNAIEGVKYYLVPDLSKLTNVNTIGGALRQAFFSLSLGMGALITYGSYLSKNENIVSSSALITLFDVGIAFIAGLMMFPLVAYNLGGDMSDVQGGAGLIFVTLPGVFETLGPTLGVVVGGFFFLLLSFAALTSTVSLLEVPVSYVVDEHKVSRNKAVIIMSIIIFVIGLPSLVGNGYSDFFTNYFTLPGGSSDFMTLVGYITDVLLMFGGFLIVTFAAYVWKKENLSEEISQGYEGYDKSFVKKFLNFCISYLCPVLLGLLFLMVVFNNFFGINLLGG
ncbi:MAG: sodium-dependent transporter [Ekhidna sp.]